jgi:uncharacterized protein
VRLKDPDPSGFFFVCAEFGHRILKSKCMKSKAAPDASTVPETCPCLRPHAAGACLSIAVAPNARRSEVAGLHDGALRIRLAAQPIDGRANDALLAWLADELELPKRGVELLSGQKGRRKQIVLHAPFDKVQAWLIARLASCRD